MISVFGRGTPGDLSFTEIGKCFNVLACEYEPRTLGVGPILWYCIAKAAVRVRRRFAIWRWIKPLINAVECWFVYACHAFA